MPATEEYSWSSVVCFTFVDTTLYFSIRASYPNHPRFLATFLTTKKIIAMKISDMTTPTIIMIQTFESSCTRTALVPFTDNKQ